MSKRATILNRLKTELEALSIFNLVTKKAIALDSLSQTELPVCIIVPGDMPLVPKTSNEYTTGSSIQSADGWEVSLIIYKSPPTDIGENEFDDFDNTLVEPIIENIINGNLDGNVLVVIPLAVNLFRMRENNNFIGEIILGLKYDFATTDY